MFLFVFLKYLEFFLDESAGSKRNALAGACFS